MLLCISRCALGNIARYSCLRILKPFNDNCRSYAISSLSYRMNFNFRQILNSRSYCVSEQLEEKWVTISFLRKDGTRFKRRGKVGNLVKDLIEECDDPDLEGYGMCGGFTTCATCQLIFPREYYEKLPKPSVTEMDMLYFTNLSDRSRCGCCVTITEHMDGMTLEVPPNPCSPF